MKVIVKMLHGKESMVEVDDKTKGSDLKNIVSEELNVSDTGTAICLVYKGKTISDEMTMESIGISDGAKIHLMVKKSAKDLVIKDAPPSVSDVPDLFMKLETLLLDHLSPDETTKVVKEFKKNCETMIDSMNFDDIERFAASNFTEF